MLLFSLCQIKTRCVTSAQRRAMKCKCETKHNHFESLCLILSHEQIKQMAKALIGSSSFCQVIYLFNIYIYKFLLVNKH